MPGSPDAGFMHIRTRNRRSVVCAVLLAAGLPAAAAHTAQQARHDPGSQPADRPLNEYCRDTSILPSADCGLTPNSTFDAQGRLWTAFVQHGHVYVTRSDNGGKDYTTAVAVNSTPESVYTNGENRPKLAFGTEGEIYVSWTHKTPGMFTGDIRFSRSLDRGASFERPQTVNTDSQRISHRFDALTVDGKGNVYLLWLDKRDQQAAKTAGRDYLGAALYYALSTDHGASFDFNRKIADNSCECCRIATAVTPDNRVVALWRHVFDGGIRDHALVELGPDGVTAPPRRATLDDWRIDACPHHGPDLALDSDGYAHMVWFTQGSRHQGLLYGRFNPRSGVTDQVRQLDAGAGASHPQIAISGTRLVTAWKAFNGIQTALLVSESSDGGRTWSADRTLAVTAEDSDHPLLLTHDGQVYAGWQTRQEGYRVLPVTTDAENAHARR